MSQAAKPSRTSGPAKPRPKVASAPVSDQAEKLPYRPKNDGPRGPKFKRTKLPPRPRSSIK